MQIILYDTPGVIKKEMHKLDSMMMKNVRSAIGSADCVVVVVDACKAPEKVLAAILVKKVINSYIQPFYLTRCKLCAFRLMKCWKKVSETKVLEFLFSLC